MYTNLIKYFLFSPLLISITGCLEQIPERGIVEIQLQNGTMTIPSDVIVRQFDSNLKQVYTTYQAEEKALASMIMGSEDCITKPRPDIFKSPAGLNYATDFNALTNQYCIDIAKQNYEFTQASRDWSNHIRRLIHEHEGRIAQLNSQLEKSSAVTAKLSEKISELENTKQSLDKERQAIKAHLDGKVKYVSIRPDIEYTIPVVLKGYYSESAWDTDIHRKVPDFVPMDGFYEISTVATFDGRPQKIYQYIKVASKKIDKRLLADAKRLLDINLITGYLPSNKADNDISIELKKLLKQKTKLEVEVTGLSSPDIKTLINKEQNIILNLEREEFPKRGLPPDQLYAYQQKSREINSTYEQVMNDARAFALNKLLELSEIERGGLNGKGEFKINSKTNYIIATGKYRFESLRWIEDVEKYRGEESITFSQVNLHDESILDMLANLVPTP